MKHTGEPELELFETCKGSVFWKGGWALLKFCCHSVSYI